MYAYPLKKLLLMMIFIQVQQNVDAALTFGGSCGSFSSVLVRLVDIKSAAPQDALFI